MPTKTKTTQPETPATKKATKEIPQSNPAAASQGILQMKPKPATSPVILPERYSAFVESAREAANSQLERYFHDFIKDGLWEEKWFLAEVFSYWSGGFGNSGVKAHGEHEIPLFSAIQDRLDGMHLIPVESSAMVWEVEKFITDKIAEGWEAPVKDHGAYRRETEETISERLRGLVERQVQFFASRCKRRDLNFLIDLLEQWEALTVNPEFWEKTEEPLAAAAEIQRA